MKLFDIENNEVIINPEIRIIPEVNAVIKKDKDRFKRLALKELAFIYFYCDYKSDCYYLEEPTRTIEALKLSGLDKVDKWKIDDVVKACIEFYEINQESTSIKLLKSARIGADKISKYLIDVDLSELDGNGKLVHKASDVGTAINNIAKILNSLNALETQVKIDKMESSIIKGGGIQGDFEDE